MSIRTYTSIITLNINRLNAPTKRYRLTGYKNKTHIYAAYKRPTSDLQTESDGKRYSMQMEIRRKLK